jgi:hypothetical protein
MAKRILVTIKLLLKENPILPTAFNFKGQCLLETLMKNLKEMGHKVADVEIKKTKNNDDDESLVDSIIGGI